MPSAVAVAVANATFETLAAKLEAQRAGMPHMVTLKLSEAHEALRQALTMIRFTEGE